MTLATRPSSLPKLAPLAVVVPVLFTASGATALATEVVLNRLLTYVFGSSHLATATVLAAYMSGLALGTFLLGRCTAFLRRPILVYGVLEGIVGGFLAALPFLFAPFRDFTASLSGAWSSGSALPVALRFGLAFLFVLLPTVLMGGTLPVLVSAFGERGAIRRKLPVLYALNTLGAAGGTLLGTYGTIPLWGLDGTLWACSAVNLSIAAVAVALGGRARVLPTSAARRAGAASGDAPVVSSPARAGSLPDRSPQPGLSPPWLVTIAFLQGFLVFVLEVVWTHLIGTVIGVTVHAFAIMLSVILLGIAAGSLHAAKELRHPRATPLALFIRAETLLSIGVCASLFLWDRFPDMVATSRAVAQHWSFAAREAARFAFALLGLFPATVAMGMALPALAASLRSGAAHGDAYRPGRWVGRIFGANTLGCIVGSITAGFVLLGNVPSETLLGLVSLTALSLVGLVWIASRWSRQAPRGAGFWPAWFPAAAACCVIVAAFFPGWDRKRLTTGSHYYWTVPDRSLYELVFFREDAQSGFITVEEYRDGTRQVKTNGKYEGSNLPAEFQDKFALLGALYVQEFDRAALLGLGPGRTLALLHDMPFEDIDVFEFSPAMIEAAYEYFPELCKEAMDDKERVHVICDDGRNFLQTTCHRYDLVTVGITGAAFAGVGSIYSREFMETVESRLDERGVFLLWIQMHHVFARDVRSVLFTVRSVFPHVHLYAERDGGQGYIVASAGPLAVDTEQARVLSTRPRIRRALGGASLGSMLDLVQFNVFSTAAELDAFFASNAIPDRPLIFTDYHPRFEYSTPVGLAARISGHDLRRYSTGGLPAFEPPLEEAEYRALLERRGKLSRARR